MVRKFKGSGLLGLSGYEISVYSAFRSSNEGMKASQISEISGVPNSKVYAVLKTLENKGLVRHLVFRSIGKFKNIDTKTFEKLRSLARTYGLRITLNSPCYFNGERAKVSKCFVALPVRRYVKKRITLLKRNIRLLEKLI
jgi:hypothetical protein